MAAGIVPYEVGGEFSTFSIDQGNYRVEVTDAQHKEASTGRNQLVLELTVKNDPNHPAKEGKKLTNLYQGYPMPTDTAEAAKQQKGFMKRLVFDGFGLSWPKDGKAFDPRVMLGKEAWVQITNDKKDGKPKIRAIAPTAEGLPVLKISTAVAAAAVKGNGAARAARR